MDGMAKYACGAIAAAGRAVGCRRQRAHFETFLSWGVDWKLELAYIQPGKPVQNAHVESFNDKLRDECLNMGWFRNLWQARTRIAAWRKEYNCARPHSSLGYQTPETFR